MMRLLKKLKNKKGLTLLELIVGLLIFSIIAVAVSTTLAPTLFAYMRANHFAEYNTLLDNLANQIISDISQANSLIDTNELDVLITGTGDQITISTPTRVIRYTVNAGILQKATGNGDYFDVFSRDFYNRKDLSIRLNQVDNSGGSIGTAYILTVRLRENSTPGSTFEIEREYAVRPLILNQKN